jgi:hypothetical protein
MESVHSPNRAFQDTAQNNLTAIPPRPARPPEPIWENIPDLLTDVPGGGADRTFTYAERFVEAGYSLAPILRDGSKAAAVPWRCYLTRRPTLSELRAWFKRLEPFGIGIIHGAFSGNSEAIDIDLGELWPEFNSRALVAVPKLAGAPVVKTPRDGGGYQVYLRSVDPPPGNLKLALRPNLVQGAKPQWLVSIETRGQGGYTVGIGSPPQCHPTGRCYELISGSFHTVPVLTTEERAALMGIALSFDQRGADHGNGSPVQHQRCVQYQHHGSKDGDDLRPGDVFNQTATWSSILAPHGWTLIRTVDGVGFWRRPGKNTGIGATTNHAGYGLLYVFSSNACPFEAGRAYSRFSAWVLLEHRGNYSAAARELWRWGR